MAATDTLTDQLAGNVTPSKKSAKARRAKADGIARSAAAIKQASDAKKAAKKGGAKATAKKAAGKAAAKTGNGRGRGIGAWVKEQIMAGASTEQIVAGAQKKFPGCAVKNTHVPWYKARLREEGFTVPEPKA